MLLTINKNLTAKNRGRGRGDIYMALTRSFLRGLGLEDNQVTAIIEAHTDTVAGLKDEATTTKEKLEKEVDALHKELDDAKSGSGDWETKYNELNEQFEAYKTDQANKATQDAKANAYKALLKAAGVSDKRIDSIMRVSDMDTVTLNKDGSVRDADKLTENIKEEWSDFIVQTATAGAKVSTPPGSGKATMTKAEIKAIKDTKARQQAIAENIELFL